MSSNSAQKYTLSWAYGAFQTFEQVMAPSSPKIPMMLALATPAIRNKLKAKAAITLFFIGRTPLVVDADW
jgi:hypothetical protein